MTRTRPKPTAAHRRCDGRLGFSSPVAMGQRESPVPTSVDVGDLSPCSPTFGADPGVILLEPTFNKPSRPNIDVRPAQPFETHACSPVPGIGTYAISGAKVHARISCAPRTVRKCTLHITYQMLHRSARRRARVRGHDQPSPRSLRPPASRETIGEFLPFCYFNSNG